MVSPTPPWFPVVWVGLLASFEDGDHDPRQHAEQDKSSDTAKSHT